MSGQSLMMEDLSIRRETEDDYRAVEELTREAFWNLYVPGCDEHYLAHILRRHPDFVEELDLVAVHNGNVVGNIMYTKSHVTNDAGEKLDTLTFGPVSVLPEVQRRGVGSALIKESIAKATEGGHKAIIIQGHPRNYCKHGFRCTKDLNVSNAEGRYPFGLLVLELEKGILQGHHWRYFPSTAYEVDEKEVDTFDRQFAAKKKEHTHTQDEFDIAVRSYVE